MAEMSQKVCFKVEKDGNNYEFCMPYGSACGMAYDACHEVLRELVNVADRIAAKAEAKKDAEVSEEVE